MQHIKDSSLVFYEHSEACNFIKKETLVQVFSCEFSIFFTERLWTTNSEN